MASALYRKYRPKNFSDIVGQNSIIQVLKNQIKENKISHAYIFEGTRGTGKTSTAKVFAKAVNCLNYSKEEGPCNECINCVNNEIDTFEIDAASNNSVDNIRELKESIIYNPQFGRYKIYIIDEVHMLSLSAFNALLKTLEEPPSHVIFILATTEVNKIPSTILSRCQRFEFKKVLDEDIKKRLKYILEKENIEYDEKAIDYIVELSYGALRDAISLIDQISSLGKVNVENVNFVLGNTSLEKIDKYIESIFKKDINSAFSNLKEIVINSSDVKKVPSELIKRLLDMIYFKSKFNLDSIFKIESIEKIINTYTNVNIEEIILKLSSLENQMKFSKNPEILLTSFTVDVCKFATIYGEKEIESLLKRVSILEEKIESLSHINNFSSDNRENLVYSKNITSSKDTSNIPLKKEKPKEIEKIKCEDEISESEKSKIEFVNSLIDDIKIKLRDLKHANIGAFLHEGNIRRIVGENIYISYSRENSFHKKMIEVKENMVILIRVFEEILRKNVNIHIVFDDEIIEDKEDDENKEYKEKLRKVFNNIEVEIE